MTTILNPSVSTQYDLGVLELSSDTTGNVVDIRNMYIEMNLYENILHNNMTCDILIIDGHNLIQNMPIIGEEKLHIVLNSPIIDSISNSANDIDLVFDIYNISARGLYKDRVQSYILHGITPHAIINESTKVSRSFVSSKNKKPHQIVSTLFNELNELSENEDDLVVEKTKNELNFISPKMWNYYDTINWICDRSISEETENGVGFFFWENINGYNFKSFESLSNTEPLHKLTIEPLNINANELVINAVSSWNIESHFNTLNNVSRGMTASKLLKHDMLFKKTSKFSYDYIKSFDGTASHIGGGRLLTKHSVSDGINTPRVMFVPDTGGLFSEVANAGNNNSPEHYTLQREKKLQELNNIKLKVIIPGNATIASGDKIEFDIPSNEPFSPTNIVESPRDELLSGEFIVFSVRHKLTSEPNGDFATILMVIKDSYEVEPI